MTVAMMLKTNYDIEHLAEFSEVSVPDYQQAFETIRRKKAFICDMDGVLYHGKDLLPGVKEFIEWLNEQGKKYLFLTNNSAPTPRELSQKMERLGVTVSEDHFFTSAMATAKFLQTQKPKGGTCYVIGEAGLTYALYEAGFIMNDTNPDYVVIGEGNSHNYEKIMKACNLVYRGAKLVGTNPDANGPIENGGIQPATGAFVTAVEVATGKKAFYCGKPSSLMMRYAAGILSNNKKDTCIVGDRMDTDILAGIWAQIDPVLVLSGVATPSDVHDHAYRPFVILNGVGELASAPFSPIEFVESKDEDNSSTGSS